MAQKNSVENLTTRRSEQHSLFFLDAKYHNWILFFEYNNIASQECGFNERHSGYEQLMKHPSLEKYYRDAHDEAPYSHPRTQTFTNSSRLPNETSKPSSELQNRGKLHFHISAGADPQQHHRQERVEVEQSRHDLFPCASRLVRVGRLCLENYEKLEKVRE